MGCHLRRVLLRHCFVQALVSKAQALQTEPKPTAAANGSAAPQAVDRETPQISPSDMSRVRAAVAMQFSDDRMLSLPESWG
jgi:hypothetical protein